MDFTGFSVLPVTLLGVRSFENGGCPLLALSCVRGESELSGMC